MLAITLLGNMGVSGSTGEKPQSKVWEHDGQWWSVMPANGGSWIWRLNGTSWTPTLRVSTNDGAKADVLAVGNLAHILLVDASSTQLASVEYDDATNSYVMWSARPGLVSVPLSGAETATMDVDSTGRMWVCADAGSNVQVRYSDGNYSSWSGPITVASGIASDDISVITAMPNGMVGVLWSNQNARRFGFKVHRDVDLPNVWSAEEGAAIQSARNIGGGMADDHLNFAVASDGTLYAAVKTSYDSSGQTKIALLVRRPNGVWDNMYSVDTSGTRPTVVLSEAAGKLIVAYAAAEGTANIMYREMSTSTMIFGPKQTLIGGSLQDVTSTKQVVSDDVVFMAGNGSTARSVLYSWNIQPPPPPPNQAPAVDAGPNRTIPQGGQASLDGTVTDDGPIGNVTYAWSRFSGPGTVTFTNGAAVDTTASFSVAGTYVLRLTASDGQLSASDNMTVVVEPPPQNPPPNLPPTVSAGPDRTIVEGTQASLDGTVTDDGPPGNVTYAWSKFSGPGTVAFANGAAVDTTATFSQTGTYVLRLTANDGQNSAQDEMTIIVEATPPRNNPPSPVTVAYQDGVGGYTGTRDTMIRSGNANTNYGGVDTLELDGRPDIASLIGWDLSSIPDGSTILSAAIELTIANRATNDYNILALDRAWEEFGATWRQAAVGALWATQGANGASDRNATSLGVIAGRNTGLLRVTLNAAGTAAVQRWVDDSSTNHGLVFQNYTGSDGLDFRSSEFATVAQRPRLVVTYQAPGGPGSPTNEAPVVDAGGNQTIAEGAAAALNATVTDDGLPRATTTTWSKFSGPGVVTFGNAGAVDTSATFSAAGTYVLRLTADDGELSTTDDVTITVQQAAPVNQPPQVDAGLPQTIAFGASASLNGTVTDDGPAANVTTSWTKASGPGTVTFGNSATVDTSATFSAAGQYVLRLTANDGQFAVQDEVTITVNEPVNPQNGLVGRWTFNNGGQLGADASGLGNHGTVVGNPQQGAGAYDAGILMDGNDRILINDAPSVEPAGQITISTWARPTARANQTLVKKGRQGSADGYEIGLSSTGQIFVRFNQQSQGDALRVNATWPYLVNSTAWMHVAATYDGSTIRLYVNGVLQGSLAATFQIGANNLPLSIGAEDGGAGAYRGGLDDVRLYNRALSAEEIAAIVNGG